MREIKFKYIYGIDGEEKTYFSKIFTMGEIESGCIFDPISDNPFYRNYSILRKLQFIGLKDKNGKEIYKGDMLRINDEEHEGNAKIVCVEYKRGGFVDSYFHRYIGNIKTHKIEIIGNIYENPELLKEQ